MAPDYTTRPSDDFAQRLSIIRRQLHGLRGALNGITNAVDELEREMRALYAPQSDGERAAQQARQIVYRQGPSETKIIRD